MSVEKSSTNNFVFQKRFGVKLSSASIFQNLPDILTLQNSGRISTEFLFS